jgi:4-diphosphocytidyl-2-C-methyl-D-erythritol kinase
MLSTEFAPAKINLTLEVLGRRSDGYHELRSLVAFAEDAGDRLTLGPEPFTKTGLTGPFAAGITGSNLVDKAVAAVSAAALDLLPRQLTLEKNLPVASGIGGGSSDAAAALRLLARNYPRARDLDLPAIAHALGADVPVCLRNRAAVMTGIGERLEEVVLPDDLFAVLTNPLINVPENKTAQVFRLLGAPTVAGALSEEEPPVFSTARDVIAYAAARGNGLAAPSRQLFAIVDTVFAALTALPESRLVQLSGAGPTCFALFETRQAATGAAAELARRRPDWWIKATRLR